MAGALIRREALGPIRLGGALGFGDFLMWFRMAEKWQAGILGMVAWSWRQSTDAGSRVPILKMVEDYQTNMDSYLREVGTRRPGWSVHVNGWRKKSARFCRWALIYEIIQQHLPRLPTTGGTLFQMYGYRLEPAQLRLVEQKLDALNPTRLEKAIQKSAVLFAGSRILKFLPCYLLARPQFCRLFFLR